MASAGAKAHDARLRQPRGDATTGGLLPARALTSLAKRWLSGAWSRIADSGAAWSAVAFVSEALRYRQGLGAAAICGLGTEVSLIVGYLGYAELIRDGRGDLSRSHGSAWPSWRGPVRWRGRLTAARPATHAAA